MPIEVSNEFFSSSDLRCAIGHILTQYPSFGAAIANASEPLAQELFGTHLHEFALSEKALRRVAAYVLRAAYRPTPFGMFASVGVISATKGGAPIRFNPAQNSTRTRIDSALIHSWLDRQSAQTLNGNITYALNPTLLYYAGYVITDVLKVPRPNAKDEHTRSAIRVQPHLRQILDDLPKRTTHKALHERIRAHGFSEGVTDRAIQRLINASILVPCFWPSLIREPLDELVQALEEAPAARTMLNVKRSLEAFDRLDTASRTAKAYGQLSKAVKSCFGETSHPLHVDTYHATTGSLPDSVKRDIQLLAELCARTARTLDSAPLVRRLRAKFEGEDRLIPLADLVGPRRDLQVSKSDMDWKRDSTSDEAATAGIVQDVWDCLHIGQRHLRISDQAIRRYLDDIPTSANIASMEVGFHLLADSWESILEDDFHIIPSAFPPVRGRRRSLQRFLDLPADIREIGQAAVLGTNPCEVELVYTPAVLKASNVAIRELKSQHHLSLGLSGFSQTGSSLDITKLFVGIDGTSLFLYSDELGRRIELRDSTMVVGLGMLPAAYRFLLAFTDPIRLDLPFRTDAFERLPYLPRMTNRNLIIRPARLLLLRSRLLDAENLGLTVAKELDKVGMVPPVLATVMESQPAIPLDVSSSMSLQLFDERLRQSDARFVALEEFLIPTMHNWLRSSGSRYVAEFVAGIEATSIHRSAAPAQDDYKVATYGDCDEWLYYKLYVSEALLDAFLVGELGQLIQTVAAAYKLKRWFFVRYEDTDTHIRLRLEPVSSDFRAAAALIEENLQSLMRRRTIKRWSRESYLPEFERYGGADAIAEWHSIFAEDSEVILRSGISPFGGTSSLEPWLFVARVIIAAFPTRSSLEGWIRHVRPSVRKLSPDANSMLRQIADALVDGQGAALSEISRNALFRLRELDVRSVSTKPAGEVLPAVIHMHFNRLGVRGQQELEKTTLLLRAVSSAAIRGAWTDLAASD